MRSLLVVLLCLFAIQALSGALAAKPSVRKLKGAFFGPWLQAHRHQILNPTDPKIKPYKNFTQAVYPGNSEGVSVPWFALIITKDGRLCGGALITSRYVVGTYGCYYWPIEDKELVDVTLGAYSDSQPSARELHQVDAATSISFQENFDGSDDKNEISLIKLPAEATIGQYITPIAVWPTATDWTGTDVTFAGYGGGPDPNTGNWVFPTGLVTKVQKVLSESECASAMGSKYDHSQHLCATVQGEIARAEQGDYGGPVYSVDGSSVPWLIGLVSWPYDDNIGAGKPSKFARLHYYLCWLEEKSNWELEIAEAGACPGRPDNGGSACAARRKSTLKKHQLKKSMKEIKANKKSPK